MKSLFFGYSSHSVDRQNQLNEFRLLIMSNSEIWYVVKQEDQTCRVMSFASQQEIPEQLTEKSQWGSFKSEQEAIAKKIGLIRAGKCKPE